MKAKKPILLIGNGPNRLDSERRNPSWDKLMSELAYHAGHRAFHQGGKPLPLAFEEVLAVAPRFSNVSERELKERVARVAQEISSNWLHRELLLLPVSDLLTTNNDYSLLDSPGHGPASPGSSETSYSLFRIQEVAGKRIWHMHGEANAPDTILLGHDHYVRYAGRIREYLNSMKRTLPGPEAWGASTAVSPLAVGEEEFEDLPPSNRGTPRYSWVDLFLTRELHLVGFGLDFSEIILWWLLTLRAREEEQEKRGLKSKRLRQKLDAVWWECSPDAAESSFVDRKEVAEALGVEVLHFAVKKNNYREAYERLLLKLSSRVT